MVKFLLGKGIQVQKTDEEGQHFAFDKIQSQEAIEFKWCDQRKFLDK